MFNKWYDISKRNSDPVQGAVLTAQICWELYELINLFDALKPKRVLEIGSQFGGTLYYWLSGAEPGAKVANIDILQNMKPADADNLPDRWSSWAPANVDYKCFIGRSDNIDLYKEVIQFLGSEIDFLFIDADHSYEGAKYDFCRYGPHVRRGGMIVIHDLVTPSFAPHIQVERLWREIQQVGYHTQELKAGGRYGGIGVIYV